MGKGVAQKPLAPARVYMLVPGKPEEGPKVVIGTTHVLGFKVLVLFDLRPTHSFLSIMFIRLSGFVVRTLEPSLVVTTLVGKTVVCKLVLSECPLTICGSVLPINLVVLPMFSYDVILGMDWLARH